MYRCYYSLALLHLIYSLYLLLRLVLQLPIPSSEPRFYLILLVATAPVFLDIAERYEGLVGTVFILLLSGGMAGVTLHLPPDYVVLAGVWLLHTVLSSLALLLRLRRIEP